MMTTIDLAGITNSQICVQQHWRPDADPRMAFFDQRAPTWNRNFTEAVRTLDRLTSLRERLGLKAGQSLLEVGCGTGLITGWLVENVFPGQVVAADFSREMLIQAQKRKLPAELWLMDICEKSIPERLFDVVFCFNSFPHFRDKVLALQNISRLLAPDGRLLILHLDGSTQLNQFHTRLAHPVCNDLMPTADAWPGLMEEANLKVQSFTDEPELFLLEAVAGYPACRQADTLLEPVQASL